MCFILRTWQFETYITHYMSVKPWSYVNHRTGIWPYHYTRRDVYNSDRLYFCLFSMDDCKPRRLGLRRCSSVENAALCDLEKLSKQRYQEEQPIVSKVETLETKRPYSRSVSFTDVSSKLSRSFADLLSICGQNNKGSDTSISNTNQTSEKKMTNTIERSKTPIKVDIRKLIRTYTPLSPPASPESTQLPLLKPAQSPQENREMNTWAPTSL